MGDKEIGVLYIANSDGRKFSERDLAILSAIEGQIDNAIEHAKVYRQLQLRNKELETLYRIDRIRDSTEDLQDMLDQILVELQAALDAEMGFIMLYSEQLKKLELKAIDAKGSGVLLRSEKDLLSELAQTPGALTAVTDYFPKDTLVAIDTPPAVAQEARRLEHQLAGSPFYMSWSEALAHLGPLRRLLLAQVPYDAAAFALGEGGLRLEAPMRAIRSWAGEPDGFWKQLEQWDIEDYFLRVYHPDLDEWVQMGDPFNVTQLRDTSMFGPDFDPTLYDRPRLDDQCLTYPVYNPRTGRMVDRCAYLEPAYENRGNAYGIEDGVLDSNFIQRIATDTLIDELGDTLTYGVYVATLTNMNPSVGQYVSVTAFDYGSAQLNIQSLETKKGAPGCTEFAIPVYSADVVEVDSLKVSVFPNPYKIAFEGHDGKRTTYYDLGLEAPEKRAAGRNLDEQDRRIWFINLPREATIRIYTLDGDLVRTIDHYDEAFTSDYSSRAYWDLISRNTQAVVSGVYIYRVDSDLGSQVGKIVVVK